MTTEVTLFCVIDGDSSVFPVDIPSSKTIDHLKDAIKKKKLEFHDIDASKLTLWHVAISSISKKPITLSNLTDEQKAQKNPEKLEDPTSEVSEVFGAVPPKKTIHVIIERPAKREENEPIIASLQKMNADLQKEIADLKQQLHTNANLETMIARLQTMNANLQKEMANQEIVNLNTYSETTQKEHAELKQQLHADTYITLNIVNNRDRDEIVCTYSTEIKTATIESLRENLQDPYLEFDEFEEVQISVCQETYNVGRFELFPKFDLKPKELTELEEAALEDIVKACILKHQAYSFDMYSNEATRSSIVDAFMIGAMQFYASDMLLTQQEFISGSRGYGNVDFAVIDRINQTQILGVTVVKISHVQAFAQNMVQLDVALHNSERKRTKKDDGDCPRVLKAYGIVTDSFQWVFVESTLENGTLKYR
ncbi:hypothetical protein BX616_005448, partial [Lobosporangium transversale]